MSPFDPQAFDDDAFDTSPSSASDVVASVAPDLRLEVMLDGVWTDITDDVELLPSGLAFNRGISGNGPTDCVADSGELNFTLDNSVRNSGGVQGYYSPNHGNCRTGWTYDIPVRLTFIVDVTERVHFTGTIRLIDPEPGIYAAQRVRVQAFDLMNDLHETSIREVDIATDQSEDQVIDTVLDSLPTDVQPVSRDIDAGVDVFPYVFDRLGPDTKAAAVISDAARSSFGLFAVKGDGTPMFRSRHTRALSTSAYTFSAIRRVQIPTTLDTVYRVVRTVVHPKTIDALATSVLYALEGQPQMIAPGATLTIWGQYRDTTDSRTLIGGLDRVVPIEPTVDYLANSAEDGSGDDETANVSITTSDFATTAKFVIRNDSMVSVYLTLLQIRGKRVLDIGNQTLQSPLDAADDRRTRPLVIDLPLQADPSVGQDAADYVRQQYGESRRQIEQIEYMPNYSEELLDQFMLREIGDMVAVTEDQTGLTEVGAVIHSISVQVFDALTVICTYGLAPSNPLNVWQWGIVGASEWGETTVYGF